jgi:hypothetical protein
MLKLTISVNKNLDIFKFERLKIKINRLSREKMMDIKPENRSYFRDAFVEFLLSAPNKIFNEGSGSDFWGRWRRIIS